MKTKTTLVSSLLTVAGIQAVGLLEFIAVTGIVLALVGGAVYCGVKLARKSGVLGSGYADKLKQEMQDGAEAAVTNKFGTNVLNLPRKRLSLAIPVDRTSNVRLLWSPTCTGPWKELVSACVDGITQTATFTNQSAFFRLEVCK